MISLEATVYRSGGFGLNLPCSTVASFWCAGQPFPYIIQVKNLTFQNMLGFGKLPLKKWHYTVGRACLGSLTSFMIQFYGLVNGVVNRVWLATLGFLSRKSWQLHHRGICGCDKVNDVLTGIRCYIIGEAQWKHRSPHKTEAEGHSQRKRSAVMETNWSAVPSRPGAKTIVVPQCGKARVKALSWAFTGRQPCQHSNSLDFCLPEMSDKKCMLVSTTEPVCYRNSVVLRSHGYPRWVCT